MKAFKCDKCCGTSRFNNDHTGALFCGACNLNVNRRWTYQLQALVRSVEFYTPQDGRSPAKGFFVCLGPTSEMTTSSVSIEHAALLYLANVCRDAVARDALRDDSARLS
jgi:hypothetical protein